MQLLLEEDSEDVDMDVADEEVSGVAWLDPVVAINMLTSTGQEYESMKDVFSKVPWRLIET